MKAILVVLLLAAGVVALAASPAARHAEADARIQALGPWYISTIMPDGQPGGFGSWKTRELCEAQIEQTEKRNHSYGSQCVKNPEFRGYSDPSKYE